MRPKRAAAVVLVGMLLASSGALAWPLRLDLAASAGIFAPGGAAYRQLYGAGIPVSFEARLDLGSRFGAATGLSFLSERGAAEPLDGGEDDCPLKFVRLTIPVSLDYSVRPGRNIDLRLSVGAGLHRYREEWTSLGLVTRGWKVSPSPGRWAVISSGSGASRCSPTRRRSGDSYFSSGRPGGSSRK